MSLWKRNSVIAAVVLFVCVALYLSWSYNRDNPAPDGEGGINAVGLDADAGDALNPALGAAVIASPAPSPAAVTPQPKNDFFTEQRLARQKARDGALAILNDLSTRETLSSGEREKTAGEISALASYALSEAKIESLVMAKGFNDCVAFINESGIQVIVSSPEGGLTATDVVKIQDIAVTETNLPTTSIRVQEAIREP